MLALVENVSYIDLVIEGVKALLVLALIFILWSCGKKYPELAGGSWNLIIFGFIGLEIGMALDFTDEIISYRDTSAVIDLIESIIEEGFAMLGLVLITVGFSKWFDFVGKFLGMERS
jgi:hypothetical protein